MSERTPSTKIVNIYDEGYDVYVGSPSEGVRPEDVQPGEYGFLGNPYQDMADKAERLLLYKRYFAGRLKDDRRFRFAVLAIRGRRLGCFCEDGESCHADIIVGWLEGQRQAHAALIGSYAATK